jgi:hypothetical protein
MRDLLRDEQVLSQVLRRKLLRSVVRAVGILDASARGRYADADSLRTAAVLARLVPRFVTGPQQQEDQGFGDPQWWTVEKLHMLEHLTVYDSREHAARTWRTCFDKNGPREGLFETREQAAEYGRRHYDELESTRVEGEETYYGD